MEEAVTRKFVHEDSSHIVSFCGELANILLNEALFHLKIKYTQLITTITIGLFMGITCPMMHWYTLALLILEYRSFYWYKSCETLCLESNYLKHLYYYCKNRWQSYVPQYISVTLLQHQQHYALITKVC